MGSQTKRWGLTTIGGTATAIGIAVKVRAATVDRISTDSYLVVKLTTALAFIKPRANSHFAQFASLIGTGTLPRGYCFTPER